MLRRFPFATLVAPAFIVAFACSSAPAPTDAPAEPAPPPTDGGDGDAAGGEESGEAIPFHDMDGEAKKTHMKQVIMPAMKQMFAEFDAEEFGEMNCVTCHGEGAKDGNFEMPNAALPKLTTDGSFSKEKEEHPNGTEFMMTKVVPEMAKLMHESPGEEFNCFSCHTAAE